MRVCSVSLALACICLVLVTAYSSAVSAADYASGKVIVRFQPGAVVSPHLEGGRYAILGELSFSPAKLGDSLDAVSVSALTPLGGSWREATPGSGLADFSGMYLLSCPLATDIPRLVERLKSFPGIADAQPDYKYDLLWEPDDSLYTTNQWTLENTGQLDGLPDADIDVSAAWDSVRGANIPVYVLDSGCNTHEDLSGVTRTDFAGGDGSDEVGHGTSVAGIIAAHCDNTKGIAGINCPEQPSSVIASVRIGDADIQESAAIDGLNYCATSGARIINCSWGSPDAMEDFSMANAIRNTYLSGSHGALIVASSGNWDPDHKWDAVYPAAYNNMTFAVGAVCKNGLIWRRSVGGWSGSDSTYVDVAAPGGCYEVATTSITGGYTLTFGGTSAAAPVVSGVAALLLAKDTTLTNDDLAHIIMRTATDIDPWGYHRNYGWGKVNAHRAVRFVSGPSREVVHGTISREDVSASDSSSFYVKTFKYLGWCFSDTTLPNQPTSYLVKRYRLEGTASFGSPYLSSARNVWARHKNGVCPGWPNNDPLDCSREVGWGAVDSSWSSTAATLYTYTYALYETADTSFVGFYPIHPDSVEIPYTAVLGPFDEDPVIEVTQPDGGEDWGCEFDGHPNRHIHWIATDDNGVDSVGIFWSLDGGETWPFVLAQGQTNDSSWTWPIADEDSCSSQSRVGVVGFDGLLDCNFDVSDADFTGGRTHTGQWEPMPPRPRVQEKPECRAENDATIFFNVPTAEVVSLKIFDVRGRLVRRLIDNEKMEGTHRAKWDLRQEQGQRVRTGVYFYRFTAGSFTDTGKIVVLR